MIATASTTDIGHTASKKVELEGGSYIREAGVTSIGDYSMERYVGIGVSGTDMSVKFGLGGGPTTLNIISMTALHHITTPSFVSHVMFAV